MNRFFWIELQTTCSLESPSFCTTADSINHIFTRRLFQSCKETIWLRAVQRHHPCSHFSRHFQHYAWFEVILRDYMKITNFPSSALPRNSQKGHNKMIEDQVLSEVRRIKDDLASEYDYNVRKMLDAAIRRQRNSGFKVVNLITKKRGCQLSRHTTKASA